MGKNLFCSTQKYYAICCWCHWHRRQMRNMKDLPHLLKNSKISKPRYPAIGLELTGKKTNLMTISPYVLEQYCRIWVKLFFWPFLVQFSVTFTPYIAKNQYRKFKKKIPRKGIARPQSQLPHSCVCEWFTVYLYSQDRSAYSAAGNMWPNPGNI